MNTQILRRQGAEKNSSVPEQLFKSSLAQLAERTTVNRDVSGSIPLGRANTRSQEVKAPVILTGTAGSNPVVCQGRIQQLTPIPKRAGGRWFKSSHHNDEITLLSGSTRARALRVRSEVK